MKVECFYKTLFVDLYCFGPDAGHVNFLACTFLDVFWSAGVGASCACDDVLHCLFFFA